MISISSPTFTIPRSTRPVTTVPRPVIVNTSSIGIKNGRSTSRVGSGKNVSTDAINSKIFGVHSGSPSSAFNADTRTTGVSSPGNSYSFRQLPHLELDELQDLLVIDHVATCSTRRQCDGTPTWRANNTCSRVCGIGPSVAATTKIAPSICAAPVIMFLM